MLWLKRRQLFVLILIESLLLFIGARQPVQQGRQSYADHIEGLHYLEASYFLFSLEGRVKESISLAKESNGEQKGESARVAEVQNRRKNMCGGLQIECISAGYTGEKGQITPEQHHLYICTVGSCKQRCMLEMYVRVKHTV